MLEAEHEGCDAVLPKPFTIRELIETVRRALLSPRWPGGRSMARAVGRRGLGMVPAPGIRPGQVIFVDARKESAFRKPISRDPIRWIDSTRSPRLPEVVLAATGAEIVVVYCTGGACEDSHYAADQLT
jgi:DNA-binding response OmpR family regulator